MRGDIQRGHNQKEKNPITDDANNNASPAFIHSLFEFRLTRNAHIFCSLRCEPFLTRSCLDSTDLSFELAACTKDYDSAWRDQNLFACSWISSSARGVTPYRKHPKVGDADRFAFLQCGFDELKTPVQE